MPKIVVVEMTEKLVKNKLDTKGRFETGLKCLSTFGSSVAFYIFLACLEIFCGISQLELSRHFQMKYEIQPNNYLLNADTKVDIKVSCFFLSEK